MGERIFSIMNYRILSSLFFLFISCGLARADVSRNITAQLINEVIIRDTLITGAPGANTFLASVDVTALRADELQNAPVTEEVASRIVWTLKDVTNPAQPIIGSGSHAFTLTIATHGNIMPGNFASASQVETVSFAPTLPFSLSPTTELRLDMQLITAEEDNSDDLQGAAFITPFQALAVSGNLLGGSVTASFSVVTADVTLAQSAVHNGENGHQVIVSFPAGSASFPLNSGLTFGASNVLLFRSPTTGHLVLTTSAVSIPNFTGNPHGVTVELNNVFFDQSGLYVNSLKVIYPQDLVTHCRSIRGCWKV